MSSLGDNKLPTAALERLGIRKKAMAIAVITMVAHSSKLFGNPGFSDQCNLWMFSWLNEATKKEILWFASEKLQEDI